MSTPRLIDVSDWDKRNQLARVLARGLNTYEKAPRWVLELYWELDKELAAYEKLNKHK